MAEADIERRLCNEAHKLGLVAIKLWPFTQIGIPDRIILSRGGQVLFLELKTENGKLSKRQEYWQKILTDYGFHVEVVYGLDATLERLRHFAFRADGGFGLPAGEPEGSAVDDAGTGKDPGDSGGVSGAGTG